MPGALLAIDCPTARRSLADLLVRLSWKVTEAGSVREAQHHLRVSDFGVMILDLELRDGPGLALTGFLGNTVDAAVVLVPEARREELFLPPGVLTLSHPCDPARVRELLVRLRQGPSSAAATGGGEESRHPPQAGSEEPLPEAPALLGPSRAMWRVKEQVRRMAPTGAGVLITGETGSGKEVVARSLHHLSGRSTRVFVALNCGAVSPSLFESEMFGHEQGSFSGATRRHRGAFERADRGTLFLDEVTEMPMELQVKLLRVLEGGEGYLREDLYYRLNILRIGIPPLRDRPEDILPLARHFLNEVPGEDTPRSFSPDVEELLVAYNWPGNVRELRNVVHSAALLSAGTEVAVEALGEEVREGKGILSASGEPEGVPGFLRVPTGTTLREAERRLILATLEGLEGHKTRAAAVLGISLKTLYNRLNSYGYPLGAPVWGDVPEPVTA